MNNLITASRIRAYKSCERRHYWRYEVGLQHEAETAALYFGKAWALAMEARWKGANAEEALTAAQPEQANMDELARAVLTGMIAGYFAYYEQEDLYKEITPEVEFCLPIAGQRTFAAAGKMDGLGIMHDGRTVLIENKTTASDISPDSDYWLRLRWNEQIFQYVLAARELGHDVTHVIFDVTRKPAIKPKQVPKENRLETLEEYIHRLYSDTQERPEFYFARKEVAIIESDLDEYTLDRRNLGRKILNLRQLEKKMARPEQAWSRNVGELTCRGCPYQNFCLYNISIDPARPPAGFKVGPFNPELNNSHQPV